MGLAVVFVGTVLITNAVNHVAAAALMFPVALGLANKMGVHFMPFVMILIMGTSCSFINPTSSQTNLMVQEPGGYSFGDFAKVGLPLAIIVGAVVLVVAPLVYGF